MKPIHFSVSQFFLKLGKTVILQVLSIILIITGVGVSYAAWTTLTTSQGASGQTMTQTLVQGIIDNINDLNTRVSNLAFSSGSVGIGNSSPSAKLDVGGTGNFSGTVTAYAPTASGHLATKAYVDAAVGAVGGGTVDKELTFSTVTSNTFPSCLNGYTVLACISGNGGTVSNTNGKFVTGKTYYASNNGSSVQLANTAWGNGAITYYRYNIIINAIAVGSLSVGYYGDPNQGYDGDHSTPWGVCFCTQN